MRVLKYVLLTLFVVVFPVLSALHLIFPHESPAFSLAESHRPVLVVDAGHGGEDGGAISLSGVAESHINLAIAKRIDQTLGLFGAPVVMLRQEDVSLHDAAASTLREKKVSDLHNRVDLVNQAGGTLLSIHQNSFPSGKYSGAQVFYADTIGSQTLAEAMQAALRATADPLNNRQATRIPKTVYLLNHIACPAVLVECGFLTNPDEEQRLRTPEYQTKLATAMAGCWLRYSSETPF